MSVTVRPQEELPVGGTRGVPASCWRDCRVWGSLRERQVVCVCEDEIGGWRGVGSWGPGESQRALRICLYLCVSEMVCTSSWSRAVTLGSYVQCQQLGTLGSRGTQSEHLSPATGGVHVLTGGRLSCSAGEWSRMVRCLCECSVCLCPPAWLAV